MTDPSKPLYRVADMAVAERPRERLRRYGESKLSTPELIAILLRVGVRGENVLEVAQRLLRQYKSLGGLHRAPFDDLCGQHGMGEAKTAQIKAALELGHRMEEEEDEEITVINSPEEAAKLIQFQMMALEQE